MSGHPARPVARPVQLSAARARALRLRALRLGGGLDTDADRGALPAPGLADAVRDLVTWVGAMQGQDGRGLLWSLGVRLPGSTEPALRAALERREVLRTWPMRGTLHLVPSQDARWMLRLMAHRTARAELTRRGQLGLTEAETDRAVDVLGQALAGGVRLTRAQCLERLVAAGITVAGQAGYHLLAITCRRAVACLAPDVDGEQTFVLLDDWVPGHRDLDPEEALAEIALRFVRSHGPVGRRDLAGWTGLTLGDVDRALAAQPDVLVPVQVEGVDAVAWRPALEADGVLEPDGRWLLPGFDEFLLGYKDRSLVLDHGHAPAIVPGGNGVFRSTMVVGGRVVGTWRRLPGRAGGVVVRLEPFAGLPAGDRAGFERAAERYGAYLAVPGVDVRWDGA